jgi:serine/threonine-protein phosphatase 2A catalytic subunit
MDSPMQDVDRIPEPPVPSVPLEPTTIPTLDSWIESLMNCKQLAEQDVQRLCDKVGGALATVRTPRSICVGR